MMYFKIIGSFLYQWEIGRKLQVIPVKGMTVDSVHFSNQGDTDALVVKPREENGIIVADIPNIMLQSGRNISVFSVNVSSDKIETLCSCNFPVRSRPKPSDYVYTETEIATYKKLEDRIEVLESGGATPDVIEQAVKEYLKENPVQAGATKEEAAQIAQNKEDIEKLTADKLDADRLPEAVNEALAQAKASGEFKGDPGDDYVLTEADKQEIAEMVEVSGGGGGTVTDDHINSLIDAKLGVIENGTY